MAADLSGDSNGWGYLRSYWNLNSAAGVGRHLFDTCGVEIVDHAIPDCAAHFDLLNTAMVRAPLPLSLSLPLYLSLSLSLSLLLFSPLPIP